MIHGLASTLAALLLGATPPVPAGAAALPPYAGAYEPQTVDERGLWMMADESERALRDSSFVIRDATLNAYVRHVLCRTVGEDRCRGVRIYILRVPAFNATMSPNGMLQLWSGTLLRLRSEAELAAVLGHEFSHFEQRHTLRGFKQQRGASNLFAWAGVIGGPYAPSVQMGALGSIFAFSRSQETEADVLSLRYIAAARYDAACSSEIWMHVMDEADATAFGRRQRSTRFDRVAFLATHPADRDRARYLHELAAKTPGGDKGESAFIAAMKPWRSQFLADQLKLNDFGGSEYLLGQLVHGGWSEDLLFARAELYRGRGNPRDLVSAADFYRQAIMLDPAHGESYRGLGLALLRGGDTDGGRKALRHYLELMPHATDAAMLTTLLS